MQTNNINCYIQSNEVKSTSVKVLQLFCHLCKLGWFILSNVGTTNQFLINLIGLTVIAILLGSLIK